MGLGCGESFLELTRRLHTSGHYLQNRNPKLLQFLYPVLLEVLHKTLQLSNSGAARPTPSVSRAKDDLVHAPGAGARFKSEHRVYFLFYIILYYTI